MIAFNTVSNNYGKSKKSIQLSNNSTKIRIVRTQCRRF